MNVTIIGCGWFGFPLAQRLLNVGYQVSGSKRASSSLGELKAAGINTFALDLSQNLTANEQLAIKPFLESDHLIVCIQPSLRKQSSTSYLTQLQKLMSLVEAKQYKKMILVSSSSVYPDIEGVMKEDDASVHSESSQVMLAAEDLFLNHNNGYILRFSGLIGPKRPPGRFFSGKFEIPAGDKVVNLVHLEDCIAAMVALLTADSASKVYNVCSPHHPSRSEFYTQATLHFGGIQPSFLSDGIRGKEVSGVKITNELDFSYQFNDLYLALDAC
ncbi:SDR family oxidoreductase [Parashewanella curva]|uniref:SDR family oxidoreductase n=1 Tax=Parashewanella curva TaxID=2338552 RepID=A0A3L8PWA8_9GAMM|nr:SDR family oxidoreductase [Parashewanella curva]RLV58352.1 SDR family oxidoreductase [Parashewanella curva]